MEYLLRYKKRPIRALIVIDIDSPAVDLQSVVKFCCSCWGGKDHIIIPAKHGLIHIEWIKIAKILSPDICIINSARQINTIISQINDQIGGVNCIKWNNDLVNDFLNGNTSHYGLININSHLVNKYGLANVKESTVVDYEFLQAKSKFDNFINSSIGIYSQNVKTFLEDRLELSTSKIEKLTLKKYLQIIYDIYNKHYPLAISEFGLRRYIPSFDLTHIIERILLPGNVLGIIVAPHDNYFNGFCLKWNMNRYFYDVRDLIFIPRDTFSGSRKRTDLNDFISTNYKNVNYLTIISPGSSLTQAKTLKKAVQKLQSIKKVEVYYNLSHHWFTPGCSLYQNEEYSEIIPLQNNKLRINTPKLNEYYSKKDDKWAVDCIVEGIKDKSGGYTLPPLSKLQHLVGKNVRISAFNNFSIIASKKEDFLSIQIPDAAVIFRALCSGSNYNLKSSSITSKSNSILNLIGGIESISLIKKKPFRDILRDNIGSIDKNKVIDLNNQIFNQKLKNPERDWLLKFLLNKKVLLRGIKEKCPICEFPNWTPIDKISENLICTGCYGTYHLTIDLNRNIRYRFNELFRHSLKDNGAIPVLLIAHYLKKICKHSFLFSIGLEVFKDGAKQTDIDLACICDGNLVIVECKDFEHKTSRKLIEKAKSQVLSLRNIGEVLHCDSIVLGSLLDPNSSFHENLLKWTCKYSDYPPIKILDAGEIISSDINIPRDYRPIGNTQLLTLRTNREEQYRI